MKKQINILLALNYIFYSTQMEESTKENEKIRIRLYFLREKRNDYFLRKKRNDYFFEK